MAGIKLAALWAKTGQNGETYHEGKMGDVIIRMYDNKYKQKDNQPDKIVYVSQAENKGANYKKPAQGQPQTQAPSQPSQVQYQGKTYPPPRGPAQSGSNQAPPRNFAPQTSGYVDHTRPPEPEGGDPGPWDQDPPF